MPHNFSFIIESKLCAMECPGTYACLDEDLSFLCDLGVRAVISLTERKLDPETLMCFEMCSLHLPIRDFTAPSIEEIMVFVNQVDEWTERNLPVMVHCGAGYGRTGTMLGAYFVWLGLSAAEAIRRVREARPMSIETKEQEFRIREFEALLAKDDPKCRRKRRPG